ncbi:MAG: penicillin acylase family protein [Acidobacteriota bacterium]
MAARIEIWRDRAGVPLIKGQTEKDVFHGLGMAHARDRWLQMQSVRIVGEGRSAELLADHPLLFDYDVKVRGARLAADSKEQASLIEPPLASLLDAYVEGVNAVAFTEKRGKKTLEMRLVGLDAERWEPWHCLLVLKVMTFIGLAEIQEDAERFVIDAVRRGVDPELLKEMFDPYLDGMDAELVRSVGHAQGLTERSPLAQSLAAVGSNVFAVGGARSVSGKALLGNDPHLMVNRLPAIWMEAMTECGGFRVQGSTIPGGPGFISARSNDIAWGVTYSMADVIDFWVEEVKDGRVRRGDGWVPLATRRERIGRRGKGAADVEIRETSHGILEGSGDGRHLCFGWSGSKATGAATFGALYHLAHAHSVEEAMPIIRTTDIPPLNWIVADRWGNIGYQLGGRYPVRRPGWSGLYPIAGWESDSGWSGFRDPEGLPRVVNPPSGILVSANDNRNDAGQPPIISVPHPDCRAKRIEKILSTPKAHLDILKTAQLDLKSLQAERLMPRLMPHLPDGKEKEALAKWDFRYTPESREATLFENLWREIVLTVYGDAAGAGAGGFTRAWLSHIFDETSLPVFMFGQLDEALYRGDSRWLPRDRRDAVLRAAAARAFTHPWHPWGEVQRFQMGHIFLGGRLPGVLGFDKGPLPVSGGRATPRQGSLFKSRGRPVFVAPSYRTLMEVGDEMVAETCLPGGPSESRLSGRYASEVRAWLQGSYKRLTPSAATKLELSIS